MSFLTRVRGSRPPSALLVAGALIFPILLAARSAATPPAATAQKAGVVLSTSANDLRLGDTPVRVTLIAKNHATETVTALMLSARPAVDGINVRFDHASADTLVPGAEIAFEMVIDPLTAPINHTNVELTILLEYLLDDQDASVPTPRVASTSVDITLAQSLPLEKIVETEVILPSNAVSQESSALIGIRVANLLHTPITIGPAAFGGSEFVISDSDKAVAPGATETLILEGRASTVIWHHLIAAKSVLPGTYPIAFHLPVEWTDEAGRHQSATVTHTSIPVGVFAESEILLAVAVPSFLLLPGVLLLAMIQFAWGLGRSDEAKARYPLRTSAVEFGMLSVTISLGLMLLMYPLMTQLLTGSKRNYIQGYAFEDIVFVWTLTVIVGIVIGGIWRLVPIYRSWNQSATDATKWPRAGDDPVIALEKLARRGWDLNCQVVMLAELDTETPATEVELQLLEPWTPAASEHWAAPRLVITVVRDHVEEAAQLENAVDNMADVGVIAQRFSAAVTAAAVVAKWKTTADISAPTRVSTSRVRPTARRKYLITME